MKIAFIGLGHMGYPMVKNLLKANHQVKVFDILPEKIQILLKDGAIAAHDVKDAVQDAEIIFTMLQTGKDVVNAAFDKGIFDNANVGKALYIDSSSIALHITEKLHAGAKQIGLNMLDAPVSGGVKGAEAATLTFMVGGDEKNFNRAKPILEQLGKNIIHAGPGGCGQAAKICNNMLLGISMIGVCESFGLAQKLGLDAKKLFEICSQSSGQCWSLTKYCPVPDIIENVPSNNQYQPGFMAKLMLKDLKLSQEAAERVNGQTPLGALATELYELFVEEGNGEMDFSGIYQMFSEK